MSRVYQYPNVKQCSSFMMDSSDGVMASPIENCRTHWQGVDSKWQQICSNDMFNYIKSDYHIYNNQAKNARILCKQNMSF